MVIYTLQFRDAKNTYTVQLKQSMERFLQQQQALLCGLGKQLVPYIMAQDWDGIRELLNAYENQIFVLAKQDLVVPAKIHWLSLDAPMQMISSQGSSETGILDDEAYYLRSIANPMQLLNSKIYTTEEMPEHKLINLGVGIFTNDTYWGHLEARIALDAIRGYLSKSHRANAKFFAYKIKDTLQTPQILINSQQYWLGMLEYLVYKLFIIATILWLYSAGSRACKAYKQQAHDLRLARQQLGSAHQSALMYKSILHTQYKYGAASNNSENELIDIQEVLNDAKTLNADLALLREISVNIYPEILPLKHILGNKLRLVQILSGILHEILQQLPNGSRIDLKIATIQYNDIQRLTFTFLDNGFYSSLQERSEVACAADIRAKGWSKIRQLIALETGEFAYSHTMYQGNTISFSIERQINSNVINLSI